MDAAVRVQTVITFHQPLSATREAIDESLRRCYLPLLDALAAQPTACVTLHFSGHLLDHLARYHEDVLQRLRRLTKAGRAEILGGLFYGAVPSLIAPEDVRGQVQMTSEYWESVLGAAPRGYWLPEMGWTAEVPSVLRGTGLKYGFVSSAQVQSARGPLPSVGTIGRGPEQCAVFVADSALSLALPARPAQEWIRAAIDRGCADPERLVTVWVRAESLGLEPETHRWCHDEGWLADWLAALTQTQGVQSVLPGSVFAAGVGGTPLRLHERCAPEIMALGGDQQPIDWVDFPRQFVEVDTLLRRVQRTSDRLRHAIATMEDEELEDRWSDQLATVQRLIYSAQSPDAYWRGPEAGLSDPALREATMQRIIGAEVALDALEHEADDFVTVEAEDRDGDLRDELFVSNRHLAAWIVPALGGSVRCLDNRLVLRNVLDVGMRRREPFFNAMLEAPRRDVSRPQGPPPLRGERLQRLEDDLPTDVDGHERVGIRQWLLDAGTSAEQFFGGTVIDLAPPLGRWNVRERRSGQDDDGSCCVQVEGQCRPSGAASETLDLRTAVRLSGHCARVTFDYEIRSGSTHPWLWATEIPVRLTHGQTVRVTADGQLIEADGTTGDLTGITELTLQAANGEAVCLRCEPDLDIWWTRVRSCVKGLDGYRAVEQGFVVVAVLRVEGNAQASLRIDLLPPTRAAL